LCEFLSWVIVIETKGKGMANIREVAKIASVSPSTVSRVFRGTVPVSEDARQRVIRAAAQLQYKSPEPAIQEGFQFGIIVPRFSADNLPHHPTIYSIITQFVAELDKLRIRNSMIVIDDINTANIESFFREKFNGYFIIGTNQEQEDVLLTFLEERSCPSLLLNRWVSGRHVNYVNIDDAKASTAMTEHLISLGHKNIAFIGGDENFRNTQLRLSGFLTACGNADIEVPLEYIIQKKYTEQSGYEAASRIMTLKKTPTAAFCCSDTLAIGFQQYLKEKGMKLPDEFAITGYGDTPMARYVNPMLTTIRMPAEEMGQQAVTALLNLIQNPLVTSVQIMMKAELVIRESCGASLKTRRELP
jgi:DNA-binding LacI/PurR family transcriptional regulator